jgi:hypothetical protein
MIYQEKNLQHVSTSVLYQKVQRNETFTFLKLFINTMIRTLKYKIFLMSLEFEII